MFELKNKKLAPLFLFASAVLWSSIGVFTKSVPWDGVCLSTLRGTIAAVVTAFLLHGRRIHLTRKKVLMALCYFLQGLLLLCANKYTTAANAAVLQNTSPLYIILFNAVLAKKWPTKAERITCACLFAGVALAFAGNMYGGGALGNCMALTSALFYAGVFFLSKEEGSDVLESLFLGNACYFILLPALMTNGVVWTTPAREWLLLVACATFSGVGAWLCFAVGIKYTSALQANFITMAEPVLSPVWTYIFLHEVLTATSAVGCAVVLTTLLVYNVYNTRHAQVQA